MGWDRQVSVRWRESGLHGVFQNNQDYRKTPSQKMSSKKFMWDELCHFEAVISLVETESLLQILGMCWFFD